MTDIPLVAVVMVPPRPERRVEELDVLRGLAALAVVLFHVRVPLWIGWYALRADPHASSVDLTVAWLGAPMAFFGTTVMLFFVVSGFAIHYPFAGGATRLALGPYAVRRWLRIYPPYATAVVLTIVAERIAFSLGGGSPSLVGRIPVNLAMAQNYVPPAGQLAGNPSLWSLPVEVELYLAYPVLLWMWRRHGTAAMLAVVSATSALAALALAYGHTWPMGNFAKYWIVWVSGAVLAEFVRRNTLPSWRRWHAWALAAGVVLAVAARAARVPFGFEHFLWGGIYFLVVFGVLQHPAWLSALPGAGQRALSWLGKVSYSLYLVHYPLLAVLGACWVAEFGRKPSNLLVPLTAAVVTVPAAYVLWRLVEQPSQRLARALTHGHDRATSSPALAGAAK